MKKGQVQPKCQEKKWNQVDFLKLEKKLYTTIRTVFLEKNSHFGLSVTTSKKQQQQQLKFSFCTLSQAETFWGREVIFTNLK